MGAVKTNRSNGYRRMSRFAAYGSAGTAIAIALVMAASPMAGALKPHVILPPYRGTAATQYKSISSYGNCKSSSAITGNHWVPKTGNVTGLVYAFAKGCSTAPTGSGSASAYTYLEFQVAIPVKIYTNAGHNVSTDVSYDYTLVASLATPNACPAAKNVPGTPTYNYCYSDISAGASMSMELYDQTNSTYLYGGHDYVNLPENYSYQDNYSSCNGSGTCSNSSYHYSCLTSIYVQCAASGSAVTGMNTTYINSGNNCGYAYGGHCYYWHNWTLNSSHKFWVLVFINMYADAYLYNWGTGASATGSINGATLGNTGWKIASVTVT